MTLEDEVRSIVSDTADDGQRINALADEFRRGRDVRELLPLQASADTQVVWVATWIFSEIHEKLYDSEDIVARLHELTAHADRSVRFTAINAVYPFLRLADPATQALLARLRSDESDALRKRAEVIAAQLSARSAPTPSE
jgi:hypothetical protein